MTKFTSYAIWSKPSPHPSPVEGTSGNPRDFYAEIAQGLLGQGSNDLPRSDYLLFKQLPDWS
ncbi:hypothetical protein NG796_22585 [Laspinema sp. A4]|uniref:hypothetical protein n=1 Tax=Laspinema sp. D2d TaxID=2953686 RepID=UPI0021BB229A|nr:hypothetical protein [Laspinema sp. D2d]MCT7986068.1 hypothetical protein [Laspinema sp. D2d]